MDQPKNIKNELSDVSYYRLNNEVNRFVNGEPQLEKDKEAVKAYFLEHVNPNTVFFYTLDEKLDYLVENNYIDGEVLGRYSRDFIKNMFKIAYKYKHRFRSFMGAHKFYAQYALKTDDKKRYLERFEDRNVFCALALANGNETFAEELLHELMNQIYQPATPTYLNAGKKRRGEFVSCMLIDVADDMSSIARAITSSLELLK